MNDGVMYISNCFLTLQISNSFGILLKMSLATLSMNSSLLIPPPTAPKIQIQITSLP